MRKTCTKCGTEKALDAFPIQRRNKDGRDSRCKSCAALNAAKYATNNPEKVKASQRAAYLNRKPTRDAYVKAWHEANKEKRAAHKKKWRDSNLEKAREIERQSFGKNRDRRLAAKRAYAKANRPKFTAYTQKRKAAKLNAMPAWADSAAIAAVYAHRDQVTRETGIEHHVDHIVPLQNPIVCGLHAEHNLRVISGEANRRKFNKWGSA